MSDHASTEDADTGSTKPMRPPGLIFFPAITTYVAAMPAVFRAGSLRIRSPHLSWHPALSEAESPAMSKAARPMRVLE